MRLLPLLALAALLAGCTEPPAAAPAEVPEAPPALKQEEVSWDATMAPSNCHQGPVLFMCGSTLILAGEPEPFYAHPENGLDVAGGNLTLSWTPATPTTTALKMTAYVVEGTCPDCEVNRTLTSQAGESPLRLEIPARELGRDQTLAVRVQPLPIHGTTRVTLSQDVHLEGTLVFTGTPEPRWDEDDEGEDEDEDGGA